MTLKDYEQAALDRAAERRPAVPDPRFRDQLARWLAARDVRDGGRWWDTTHRDDRRDEYRAEADALIRDVVAAEVQAHVQVAANQRAAKMLREAADWIWDETPALATASSELHSRADHLDALAQPAPGGDGWTADGWDRTDTPEAER